ncbi:hypothetical protein K438DRAFT_1552388, partial [Mycena galopus ATCC 62051]
STAGCLLIRLAVPLLTSKYGLATTLQILGIVMALLVFPILPFIKGRLPQARLQFQGPLPRGATGPQIWFKQNSFWMLLATFQGSAYFFTNPFTHDLQVNASNAAVTVPLLNASSFVGCLSMGYLSDSFNPWMLAFSILMRTS